MKETIATAPAQTRERALLVSLACEGDDRWERADSLAELGELVRSAGGEVAAAVTQRRIAPTAPCYIGRGKAQELARAYPQDKVQAVIFDDELSPAQSRNLEKILNRKVLDRTQLILDIFAQRAKSREGKLQIELAQLQYLLPRLTRMWTHLSRQSGGIGTRGPGETQLEVDRRRIQERIARLHRELAEVRQSREVQRQARRRQHWPILALVGYTNAGKSTLLNRLTDAGAYAADALFATLDPTIRQFVLPNRQKVLVTDTVGFLQKLPHDLVEAFSATLEEVREADLLLHVVDLADPHHAAQMEAVEKVLESIGARDKHTLVVFNKLDVVANPALVEYMLGKFAGSVAISARTGEGMPELLGEIENQLQAWRLRVELVIPNHLTALLAELHRVGRVVDLHYEGENARVIAHLPPQLQGKVRPYIVAPDGDLAHPGNGARRAPARKAA